MGKFFDAWQDVANDPDDITNREILILTTDLLLDKSKQAYQTLIDNQIDIWDNIKNNVKVLNDRLETLAKINVKLNSVPNDPSLLDERDKLIKKISELINVNVTLDDKGKVYLTTTKGIPLVEDKNAFLFYVDIPNKVKDFTNNRYIYNFMDNINLIKGGKLGGLAKSYLKIEEYKKKFSAFLTNLVENVNKVFAYDSNGKAPYTLNSDEQAIPFFTSSLPMTLQSLDVKDEYKIKRDDLKTKSVILDSNGKLTLSISIANQGLYEISLEKSDIKDTDSNGIISLDELVKAINSKLSSTTDSNGVSLDTYLEASYKYYNGEWRLRFTNKESNASFFVKDNLTIFGENGFAFDTYTIKNLSINKIIKDDPAKIPLAKVPNANAGDNTYAWKVVDLRDPTIIEYKNFTGNIAAYKAFIDANYSSQKDLFSTIEEKYKNEVGVDLDQELIKLTEMQKAYQASARVITVANEILDILLNLGRV